MTSSYRRFLTAGLAAALAWSVVGAAGTAAAAPAPTSTVASAPGTAPAAAPATRTAQPTDTGRIRTFTLLTGDVVQVTTDGEEILSLSVTPTSGAVQTQTVAGQTYVIPLAARPYLTAGTLDRQLFNITGLLADGYDDQSRGSIPLIVQFGARTARSAQAPLPGIQAGTELPSIGGRAVAADKEETTDLWAAITATSPMARALPTPGALGGGITKVWLDGKVGATLDTSVPQVKAPQAWAAGYDGTGSTVAVLDTGADVTHPDLAGVVVDTESFVPGEDATDDQHGHGTHVASTVAGSGAADAGIYQGVAPGADLIVGKVLGHDGYGQDSWIIAGMEWAAANAPIVSMSLGDSAYTDGLDPISQALNQLSADTGALFVVAAGNDGAPGTVGAPGAADAALTIGAVDDYDNLAWFSSQGPRTGDNAMKPDLSAPGDGITAARSQASSGDGWYTTLSGTSMAAPHVAGAAAIVKQAHPQWSAEQLKNALMSSTDPLDTNAYQVGAGRLNVIASIDGVDATGSAFLGSYTWPHDGDDPVTKTITYTNDTDTPVTLDLTNEAQDAAGEPVELGELSADQVVVPAHGSSQVTLTADVDDVTSRGQLTGEIVGTGVTAAGPVTVRTATAMVAEGERYNLDISVKDRSGRPTGGYVEFYRYGDMFVFSLPVDPETGTVATQRLEPGIYNVTSWLDVAGTGGAGSKGLALVGNPHLVIGDADTSIVLDARRATLVNLTTPRRTENEVRRLDFFHDSGLDTQYSSYSSTVYATPDYDSMWAAPTGQVPGGHYEFAARWRAPEPALTMFATTPRPVALRPLYQDGSAKLSGPVRLAVVSAGTGSAAEYQGVAAKGKAVLVTRSDAVGPFERADAAVLAGARLMIVVNDVPGVLWDSAGSFELPVVSVTAAEGAKLLAAKPGTARLWGSALAQPRYLFDVAKGWPGAIPTNLRVAPTAKQLATVKTSFHDTNPAARTPQAAYDVRADCRAHYWPPCMGISAMVSEGTTRTDYVSTYPGNEWYSDAVHLAGWEQRGVRQTLRAGSTQMADWFAPIAAPHTGDGFWLPNHSGDWFAVNVPTASGAGAVTGTYNWGATSLTSRLYHGSTLLGESSDQAVQTVVPVVAGVQQYRFEQAETQSLVGYSTRTKTSWTFKADQADSVDYSQVVLPMVQVGYRVPTALDGTARAGSKVTVGMSGSLPPGAARGGTVNAATLSVSYDGGKKWTSAKLKKVSTGSWQATLSIPRSGATSVALRSSVSDSAGNKVTQEVIKAFGVRR